MARAVFESSGWAEGVERVIWAGTFCVIRWDQCILPDQILRANREWKGGKFWRGPHVKNPAS